MTGPQWFVQADPATMAGRSRASSASSSSSSVSAISCGSIFLSKLFSSRRKQLNRRGEPRPSPLFGLVAQDFSAGCGNLQHPPQISVAVRSRAWSESSSVNSAAWSSRCSIVSVMPSSQGQKGSRRHSGAWSHSSQQNRRMGSVPPAAWRSRGSGTVGELRRWRRLLLDLVAHGLPSQRKVRASGTQELRGNRRPVKHLGRPLVVSVTAFAPASVQRLSFSRPEDLVRAGGPGDDGYAVERLSESSSTNSTCCSSTSSCSILAVTAFLPSITGAGDQDLSQGARRRSQPLPLHRKVQNGLPRSGALSRLRRTVHRLAAAAPGLDPLFHGFSPDGGNNAGPLFAA